MQEKRTTKNEIVEYAQIFISPLPAWKSVLISSVLLLSYFLPQELRSIVMITLGLISFLIYFLLFKDRKNQGIQFSLLAFLPGLFLCLSYVFIIDSLIWYLTCFFIYLLLYQYNIFPVSKLSGKDWFDRINGRAIIITIYAIIILQIFTTSSKFFLLVLEYISID